VASHLATLPGDFAFSFSLWLLDLLIALLSNYKCRFRLLDSYRLVYSAAGTLF
jgi:hypothetical protein